MSYVSQEMKHLMGKAIHTREMIREGDRVLVAVSGGKDSMALLWLLREHERRVPISYGITAVHVDPGFGTECGDRMKAFFSEQGFEYRVIRSDIGPRAHGPENGENPCFLCSRLRRKILFELAAELDCTKLAFGHHKDDLIETFFLNVFYGASISTMKPVQELFDGRLTVIRPLYMINESSVRKYARSMDWPQIDLGCPTAGSSKRESIKEMLNGFYRSNRKIRGNIFHALQNVNLKYLP
ncbi:MAG: tRNA 2-thiocytidine(32) synthetase TtcA [Deltaproteobacteria bacterium]|nr:tRNA 2-thiocytidine(32) synthetase TtcA [Deltaproteobacteria bacterium]